MKVEMTQFLVFIWISAMLKANFDFVNMFLQNGLKFLRKEFANPSCVANRGFKKAQVIKNGSNLKEDDEMKMYKAILDILERKGSASIPMIYKEMNGQAPQFLNDDNFAVEHSYIKSLIRRKNEIFKLENDLVSIRPEKEPVALTAVLHGYPGPELRVKVDFARNRFTYFEWHLDSKAPGSLNVHQPGSVDEFKKQLYSYNVWDWKEDYQAEGIIVDGTSWTVKLVTKGKTYESGGLDSFPKEWKSFCRSISRLIGTKFPC